MGQFWVSVKGRVVWLASQKVEGPLALVGEAKLLANLEIHPKLGWRARS